MNFWCWVLDNHDVLQTLAAWLGALVALAGVIVAGRYVVLTRRLAQAANTSAEAARTQAEVSRQGAEAAADQARSTRLIFEAAHRPYLEVQLDPNSFFVTFEFRRLLLTVTNHGPVPALLENWEARFRQGPNAVGRSRTPEPGLCVFPGRAAPLRDEAGQGPEQPGPDVDVEIEVTYRGFHDARYRTVLRVGGMRHQWHLIYQDAQ